jgi:large subunit ribosomal protein L19e
MNLQKKLASKILKCSAKKVWIEPKNEKVKQAITRRDIRRFIKEGVIKKIHDKKVLTVPGRKQQRTGSIKGTRKTRIGKKNQWFKVIRPQRRMLKELKDKKLLKPNSYRKVYRMAKGNAFRSRAHLNVYLKDKDLLVDEKK